MLNVAGPSFDFGNVLFAVLQECEHVRRGLLPNEAHGRLMEAARRKLAEIRESYVENGGTPGYWEELEREVLETSMPAYIPQAIEQTRLEQTSYGVWRRGDAVARVVFTLTGLFLAVLIIRSPLPWFAEDALAFFLAAGGLLFPEIMQLVADFRHTRLLNRMVAEAEKYQKNTRIHYVSEARLQEELDAVGKMDRAAESPHPEEEKPHPRPREKGREHRR